MRGGATVPIRAASWRPRHAGRRLRRLMQGLFPGLPCEIKRPRLLGDGHEFSRFVGCFWGPKVESGRPPNDLRRLHRRSGPRLAGDVPGVQA